MARDGTDKLESNQPQAGAIEVDRVDLMKGAREAGSAKTTDGLAGTAQASNNGSLELKDDIYPTTRGAQSLERAAQPLNPEPEVEAPPYTGEPIALMHAPESFDRDTPTAVFLDDFVQKKDLRVPHGEISRRAAKEGGFQTVGLHLQDVRDKGIQVDFSTAINDIDKMVASGELPLGEGDIVNISMGNRDPSFAEASKFLGFEVSRTDIDTARILSRMEEIAGDQSRSEDDRKIARRVVDTNAAITKLQERGVEVVHAAGNEGQDKFSWDFMAAKWQLSSNKPSGKPDEFSADHALTTAGDGVIPTRVVNNVSMFDSTPIGEQKGYIELGDTGTTFAFTGSGAFPQDNLIFNRETYEAGDELPRIKPSLKEPSARLFERPTIHADGQPGDSREQSDGVTGALDIPELPGLDGSQKPGPHDKFTGTADKPSYYQWLKPYDPATSDTRDPLPGEQVISGLIRGTSYSNIEFLRDNFERLKRAKTEA